MGKNELLARISDDGRARAAAIEREREAAVAAVRTRTETARAEIEAEQRQRAEREVNAILERARSQARLLQRNKVLVARWQALDRVAEAAAARITADPGYPDALAAVAKKYAVAGSTVRLSAVDGERFGKRMPVKLGPPASIAGGLIISQGRSETSFSLDDMLGEVRQELVAELSRLLFGN